MQNPFWTMQQLRIDFCKLNKAWVESGVFSFLSDLNLSALTLWIQACLAKAEEMFSCSDAPHVDHKDGLTKHVDTDEEFDDSIYDIYIWGTVKCTKRSPVVLNIKAQASFRPCGTGQVVGV